MHLQAVTVLRRVPINNKYGPAVELQYRISGTQVAIDLPPSQVWLNGVPRLFSGGVASDHFNGEDITCQPRLELCPGDDLTALLANRQVIALSLERRP